MHEYLIAFMLEPMDKGDTFIRWPLHITLVPWFRTPNETAQIVYDISDAATKFKPISSRGIQRARFGWRRKVQVTALASSELHDLHRQLLSMLENKGYNLVDKKHTGVSYQPHITKKGNAEFKPGHELIVDRIYLIKAPIANPRTRTKKVTAVIEL